MKSSDDGEIDAEWHFGLFYFHGLQGDRHVWPSVAFRRVARCNGALKSRRGGWGEHLERRSEIGEIGYGPVQFGPFNSSILRVAVTEWIKI